MKKVHITTMYIQNINQYMSSWEEKTMNLKAFLAALLVMGTLTACGGGNDEATDKETTDATQETTETEEPVEKKKIMLQPKRKLVKKQQMLTQPHRL